VLLWQVGGSNGAPYSVFLRANGVAGLKYSIIRRSAAVTISFVTGHALNYALVLGANHLLDAGGFGLFYAALLTINVLLSPMMAVMLVLARQFADAEARVGRAQVVAMTWFILGACLRWAPLVALLAALSAAAAPILGFEAWQIALLIPLTVLAVILTEILRAAFQGMLLFGHQNAIWIVTTAGQCILSVGALWLFPRVWVGIAGIPAGSIVAFVVFIPWFVRAVRGSPLASAPPLTFNLRNELPTILGYSLFILLNNSDILLGYWLLPRDAFDVYAASAILPKAIIIATFAVAQVVLPVIAGQRADGISYRLSIAKSLAAVVGLGIAATAALWLAIPWIQTTTLSIRGLDLTLMMILAVGAIALSTVRLLIVVEIALQRYAAGLAQAGAILLFAILAASVGTPLQLAKCYTAVACGFLVIMGFASILPRLALPAFFRSMVRQDGA
jgi:hypothetical protein